MILSAIASEHSIPTEHTLARVHQLLDYMATHPNAIVRFHTSEMILNLNSDALYLSVGQGRSRADIQLNGNIHITCVILKVVTASAAETKLGALSLITQEARNIRLALLELGHPQLE